MKAFYLSLFSSAVLLCSCSGSGGSNDEPVIPEKPSTPSEKVAISLSVTQQSAQSASKASRATDTAFETNDAVGIYVVNYVSSAAGTLATTGNHVDNMKFTYASGAWTPASTIYWKDESTKADFYCYYPYATPSSVTAYPFSVKADQSAEANYKASDLLWGRTLGVTPTASDVNITVKHLMSNALVYVTPGDGFTAETLAAANVSVKLQHVKTSATYNLATGETTLTGDAGELVPYKEGDCYRTLLPAQNIASGTALVVVNADGKDYTLKTGCDFKSNTKHKITVKVSKTSNGVNVGIGAWETDDTDYGGIAE